MRSIRTYNADEARIDANEANTALANKSVVREINEVLDRIRDKAEQGEYRCEVYSMTFNLNTDTTRYLTQHGYNLEFDSDGFCIAVTWEPPDPQR